MTEPLTPREFAERALLGTLLMEPGRVTAIAEWLHETDFRTPSNGTVFAHLRDMVAEAERAAQTHDVADTAWVMFAADYDVGPQHARIVRDSVRVLHTSRSRFSLEQLDAERERTGLGYDLGVSLFDAPRDVPDSELPAYATQSLATQADFDFWNEVIGDDIVVGGVAYPADMYAPDGEGGVRQLTDAERAARRIEPQPGAGSPVGETVWVLYSDEPDVRVHQVYRSEISSEQLETEQERTGLYLLTAEVDLPANVAEADIPARAAAIIAGDEPIPGTTRSPYAVPGVDAVSLYLRIANSGELGTRAITAPHLHTLMATAPPPGRAQPEAYARMVLEASIRRDIEQAGMRVGQVNRYGPELTDLLHVVESALEQIDHAQRRWEAVSGSQNRLIQILEGPTAPDNPPTPESIGAALDIFNLAPDLVDIQDAEERLLGQVVRGPSVLDGLVDRLLPEDFADENIAAAYRAAIEVHLSADRAVDAVTVAWEQQRRADQYGPGLPVNSLLRLATEPTPDTAEWAADIVMRGALSRLTAAAAENVREAAQHPGLQPDDVLHTATMSYEAVRATAARMTGPPTAASQLEGRGGRPSDERSTAADSAAARSSAQIIQLRERSARLRAGLEGDAREPGRSEPVGNERLSGRNAYTKGVESADDPWIALPGGGVRFLDEPEAGSPTGHDVGPDFDA